MQRLGMRLAVLFVVPWTAICFSMGGCSSDSDNGGNPPPDTSNRTVPTAECQQKCEAKATTCGAAEGQSKQVCSELCGSATEGQLQCLQGKSCSELAQVEDFDSACPKGSNPGNPGNPGTKKQFGDACTCPNVPSPTAHGYCQGTDAPCAASLKCIYTGGSGAGQCMAEGCCSGTTSECDANASLLKTCTQGRCTRVDLVGYYCAK